ncbi:hypothetical protein ANO11243_000620 [Dothideomycetidae sp. 11243]|nr:hypothetical protein ANO11243_000620 [fungal sp. No.11243]
MPRTVVDIRLAYRHLLTASYRAVKYSKPARYVLLERLRTSFRSQPVSSYDSAKLDRTLEFLRGAAAVNGVEHRLLRNLVHYWWQDMPDRKKPRLVDELAEHRRWAQEDVDRAVLEMGKTMDIYATMEMSGGGRRRSANAQQA